jgi:hypothetical protein
VAIRSRALIAGIVYHYIHDAFLFLVQNPKGEYFGFVDNVTFYIFLWAAMMVNIMLILIFTRKLRVTSALSPFEIEGVTDNFGFFEPQKQSLEKAKRIERISLIVFVVSIAVVIPGAFEDGYYVEGIILSILLTTSFAGFVFFKKLSKNMGIVLLLLNSICAWVTGNIMSAQGSKRIYLIYYLIGIVYLFVALFHLAIRPEKAKKIT